jgi:hypothetical protein
VVFSSSLSAASLAPSVIVSSLKGESGDCWDSVIVVILSSYFRRHFPVRKLKTRICLSGKDWVANLSPSRENVNEDGTDFA